MENAVESPEHPELVTGFDAEVETFDHGFDVATGHGKPELAVIGIVHASAVVLDIPECVRDELGGIVVPGVFGRGAKSSGFLCEDSQEFVAGSLPGVGEKGDIEFPASRRRFSGGPGGGVEIGQ